MKEVFKVSIIDQVVEILKDDILSGKYTVGEKFSSELELCSKLNVSRSSIREALRILQTLGYLDIRPGRGAFLKNINEEEAKNIREWFIENAPKLSDFIEVRLAIETLAIKIAAANRTDEQIGELEAIQSNMEAAIKKTLNHEVALLDEKFHRLIVAVSDNVLLIKLNEIISLEFRKYRDVSFNVKENAFSAIKSHRKIVKTIRNKDIEAAVSSVEEHLHLVVSDMERVIKD